MASAVQEASAAIQPHTPDMVGNAFVHQYYHILHQSPEHVHRFYQDISKLGRPGENGVMDITTTMQAINEKILSLDYGDFKAEITTVDAQNSHSGGVIVLVTGFLTGKDDLTRKFAQSFFLAPQDKGYFVLNDVFRYVDDVKYQNGNQGPVNDVEASLTPEKDASPAKENHIAEQQDTSTEEVNGAEVYNPTGNEDRSITIEEEQEPVAEVVDENPDDLQIVAESNSKIEEVPKKSYASILKVTKENPGTASGPTHSPVKPVVKSQEQPTAAAATPAPPAPPSDTQVSSTNIHENGNNQDGEAEGPSIYVKGLPANATESMLENEFKKFGSIKSGGIQVRSQKGFCFGFVEFEVASAVQSAIAASPLIIGGRKAVVEEKRSTRVNNRARSSGGSGVGYRNDGARGRGNYGGGRGYNRGDFGNRAEFGNRNGSRGGFPNRGGDGYQRDRGGDGYQRGDHVGSNGGRVNRGGGLAVNGASKNVAPRVSAHA
ncbi:hypothetical protein SLEP1_g602 [Rubroshorea leprosula]|uniref:G3BP-like protein n=1 Tax=Rubroshorea leprosula TaxID=152421 RepID=A0AAV5HB06_9ROSI|nr:hypothetical protein SLEP1_g602 [Rubroshorea leprosula]